MAESGNRRVLESPTLSAITKQAPKRSLFGYGGEGGIDSFAPAHSPLRGACGVLSPPAVLLRNPSGRPESNRRLLESPTLSAITKQAPKRGLFGYGGEGGIRTLDGLLTHTPLAGERFQPLSHLSVFANSIDLTFSDLQDLIDAMR